MCCAVVIGIGLAALPAGPAAIVIRHDRDDRLYQARGAAFNAVGAVGRAGTGTLVAPRWVLTAAHVATGFRRAMGVTFEGRRYEVEAVFAHPDWVDGGPHDIALIRLASAVEGVTPIEPYRRSDEQGAIATFVGRGGTGDGRSGPTREDGVRRAATNAIEDANDRWLLFTFDEPPAGTDLEGISGPGDSGGPALLERGGRWFVAGISIWGQGGRYGKGTYGTQEGYTRVSRYVSWIDHTLKAAL